MGLFKNFKKILELLKRQDEHSHYYLVLKRCSTCKNWRYAEVEQFPMTEERIISSVCINCGSKDEA